MEVLAVIGLIASISAVAICFGWFAFTIDNIRDGVNKLNEKKEK